MSLNVHFNTNNPNNPTLPGTTLRYTPIALPLMTPVQLDPTLSKIDNPLVIIFQRYFKPIPKSSRIQYNPNNRPHNNVVVCVCMCDYKRLNP